MARVENVEAVIKALKKKGQEVKDASVVVGYTQSYAIYVHENMEAHHPIGQAKFLEQPAREYARELAEIVRKAIQRGKTVAEGLLLAGLRLQRESQKLVPIDTGALKNSAFTALEEE